MAKQKIITCNICNNSTNLNVQTIEEGVKYLGWYIVDEKVACNECSRKANSNLKKEK